MVILEGFMEENVFKKLRLEKNSNDMKDYTQKELSKDLGIAAAKICELEKGRKPSLTELQAYHQHFNAPYEYLLGENNSRYYENMALSEELGLTGESIEHLKKLYKRFCRYPYNSSERKTPEGRQLRAINYLLERWNFILDDIAFYLDSAACDADYIQIQYLPLKYFDENDEPNSKKRYEINGFNCNIEDQDYKQFCEIYLQKINYELRKRWTLLHDEYIKEISTNRTPDTN